MKALFIQAGKYREAFSGMENINANLFSKIKHLPAQGAIEFIEI
ncbi:MAG: hypothetical protein RR100_14495 [Comamonas sp.]